MDEHAPAGRYVLQLNVRQWRREDGEITLNGAPAQLLGHGTGGWFTVRRDGSPVEVEAPVELRTPRALWVRGARLVDFRTPETEPTPVQVPPSTHFVAPCDCEDDGAALTAFVRALPPEPAVIELAAGQYRLHTPFDIERPGIWVVGQGPDTVLNWDPGDAEAGLVDAVLVFRPRARAETPIPAMESGQQEIPGVDIEAEWVELLADDYGEVPPSCVGGRDVEREFRHIRHIARIEARSESLFLDRAPHIDFPAEANPRARPFLPLTGGIARLLLRANCPEAVGHDRFTTPACANPRVTDDNGLYLRGTGEYTVHDVTIEGFGRWSLVAHDAVDTRIEDVRVRHFSNFDDGGRGYGLHLVQAHRTVARALRVERSRHGVVVGDGSADFQVLDGNFVDGRLGAIDVHGEASRDGWIRRNRVQGGTNSIVVGGGGNQTHCNDGPRHHIEDNHVSDATLAAFQVADHTHTVWFRGNRVENSPIGVFAMRGAREIDFVGNVISAVNLPVQVSSAGPVRVAGNDFVDICDPEDIALTLQGEVVVGDNRHCGE